MLISLKFIAARYEEAELNAEEGRDSRVHACN